MPEYHDYSLSYHWCRRLLLLWLFCCLASTWLCRPYDQEDMLWYLLAWFADHNYSLPPRKLFREKIEDSSNTSLTHIQLPAKYIFIRALRDSKHLNSNSKTHWVVWIGCTFGTGLIAYIIASAIPIFGSLVSLIGALCITFLAFHPMACMWLYDNWSKGKVEKTLRWKLMVGWSMLVLIIGTFLMITGTWGSIVEIVNSYRAEGGSSAWSCADNSNST